MIDPALLPHDKLSANIITATVICAVISTIFVCLRIYTRRVIIKTFDWSDIFLLGGLVWMTRPT